MSSTVDSDATMSSLDKLITVMGQGVTRTLTYNPLSHGFYHHNGYDFTARHIFQLIPGEEYNDE